MTSPSGVHQSFYAVEGLDELLAILKGHTEQAGGEAVAAPESGERTLTLSK